MDPRRATKRNTIINYPDDPSKRFTVTDKAIDKAERQRASTLVKLRLTDDDDVAQFEASLLRDEVDNTDAINSGSYLVQILGTDLAAKRPGKAYTVYKVEITHDISSWIIYRRYSQFYALLEELKSEYGKKVTKGFPPKKFIHNLSPASVDRRHQQLQDWLQSVLNNKWVVSSTALQLFIKVGKEDTDFVPRQHATTIESDIDMATTLHKFSGKWKSRWFVLRHGRLYKYASPQAKHPYGFYDMRQCSCFSLDEAEDVQFKNPRPHTFVVDTVNTHTDKMKRYFFAADNQETMKRWIAAVNQEQVKNEHNKVFGVPIESVRDRDENGVPLFLSALLTFLEATALGQEDLFTKPPDEEIKRAIDRGKALDLDKVVEDAHAVAGLIVQYLHELPDSIIPNDMTPLFFAIFDIQDPKKRLKMLASFSEILPIVNRNLLIKLFSFLDRATRSGAVKKERLTKIFGRLVFRPPPDRDNAHLNSITEQIIDNWDSLVVLDEVYAAPAKVLVIKKKKTQKHGVTAEVDKKDSSKTNEVTPVASKPAFNDYYDSNDEFEESSEEEEYTDEEVQVISIDSDYSEEVIEDLDDLQRAASTISITPTETSPTEPASKEKKSKKDTKEPKEPEQKKSKASKADQPKETNDDKTKQPKTSTDTELKSPKKKAPKDTTASDKVSKTSSKTKIKNAENVSTPESETTKPKEKKAKKQKASENLADEPRQPEATKESDEEPEQQQEAPETTERGETPDVPESQETPEVSTSPKISGLDLKNVEQHPDPMLSPHSPLASATHTRPKKQGSKAPTAARASVMPYSRPEEPQVQRTPQEQLVADLGRVLGMRRPPGGVAMFPVPNKN